MAAGRIDEDELDELVVATQDSVHVFDGASLAAVAPAPDEPCGTDWLPKGAETAQFSCEESSDTSDCAVSKFGQALAVADVDGDGRGEVVVGAPEMTVRGKSAAGAVLIYEVPSSGAAALADTRLLSTADSGNRFGAALATVPQRTRDVILAGVPGAAKTVLLYCNSLFDGDSSRCQ